MTGATCDMCSGYGKIIRFSDGRMVRCPKALFASTVFRRYEEKIMTTINPATRQAYVHFGDVPPGGRLACGQNRYASTPTTATVPKVSCPDCNDQILKYGVTIILAGLDNDTASLTPVELNAQMQVVVGWTRIHDARALGLKDIPCIVHLPAGVKSLDGIYILGKERSLDKLRFAVVNKDTRKVDYRYLDVQTKQLCDICDESLKGDESVGIAPHEEKSCQEELDLIVTEAVAKTAKFFQSDLQASLLQESLTRVLRTRSEKDGE